MDSMSKRYLNELDRQLSPLPAAERLDAVREIESHIAEALAAGQPMAAVLSRLGEPGTLAKAYLVDHHLQAASGVGGTVQQFRFFATTSLTGLFVVPVLAIFGLCCAFVTALAPFALIMRLLGVSGYMIWDNQPMPILFAIPTAAGLMVVGGLLTRGVMRLALRYFRYVAAGYHRVRTSRVA